MINIITTPNIVSWVDNHPAYTVQSSGVISQGSGASYLIWINSSFPAGKSLLIEIDGHTLTFTRTGSPSDGYQWNTIARLISNLNNNYYLSQVFQTSQWELDATASLVMTARSNGYNALVITTDIPYSSRSNYLRIVSSTPGSNPELPANYTIGARLTIGEDKTPWSFYTPINNKVNIKCDMMKSYFGRRSAPTIKDRYASETTSACKSILLEAVESYGDEPLVQSQASSSVSYLLDGEIIKKYYEARKGDWADSDSREMIVSGTSRYNVIGEDSGITVMQYRGQQIYIHLFYYNSSKTVGASENVTVKGNVVLRDGSIMAITTKYVSVKNAQMNLICIAPQTEFELEQIVRFDLHVTSTGEVFRRTYVYEDMPHDGVELLLCNKYGCLVSFVADKIECTLESEGEEVVSNDVRRIENTGTSEAYAVTFSNREPGEVKRIKSCLLGEYGYIWANGQWEEISLVPGSWKVIASEEDLLSLTAEIIIENNQKISIR